MFSLILIEDDIYYILYYENGEDKGIDMKLSRDDFMKFVVGKVEN